MQEGDTVKILETRYCPFPEIEGRTGEVVQVGNHIFDDEVFVDFGEEIEGETFYTHDGSFNGCLREPIAGETGFWVKKNEVEPVE